MSFLAFKRKDSINNQSFVSKHINKEWFLSINDGEKKKDYAPTQCLFSEES